MMTKMTFNLAGVALALGLGVAQAYPLEDRVMGCSQVQPALDAAYTMRVDGQPIEVVQAVLVNDPELLPAHRFILQGIVETLYAIPVEQLPKFENYRVLSFSVCLENIGAGFVELYPDVGVGANKYRRAEG